MSKYINLRSIILIVVIVIIIEFVTQNYMFMQLDNRPSTTNYHLIRSLKYYDHLIVGFDNNIQGIPYPPLVYLLNIPVFIIYGISLNSSKLLLLIFAVIYMLAMFGIGRELGGDTAGLITLGISLSAPSIIDISRRFFLDFPQTAMTALAFYMLIKADGFKNRKFSLLFGLTLALSFLTKWSTAFFMGFPVLWMCFAVIGEIRTKPKKLCALVSALAVMTVISAVYFYYIDLHRHGIEKYWFYFYLSAVILPWTIWFFVNRYLEKKEEKDLQNKCDMGFLPAAEEVVEEKLQLREDSLPIKGKKSSLKNSFSCRITNTGYFMTIFFVLSFSWLFWAAQVFKRTVFNEAHEPRSLLTNANVIINYMIYGLSFFPVFQIMAVIGLIILIVKYKEYLSKSSVYFLIPLNILFICFVMYYVGYMNYRYYLPLIIFMAALAGFWTEKLWLFKIPVAAAVVLISFFTFLGWAFRMNYESETRNIYAHADFLKSSHNIEKIPKYKFFYLRSPSTLSLNKDNLARWLAEKNSDEIEDLMILYYPNHTDDMFFLDVMELLRIKTYKLGKRIQVRWHYDWNLYKLRKYPQTPDPVQSQIDLEEEIDDFIVEIHPGDRITTLLLEYFDISKGLAVRLKKKEDLVSQHLFSLLSDNTKALLEEYKEETKPPEKLKKALAKDINILLKGDASLDYVLPINTPKENSKIESLKHLNLTGEALVFLNRLIFDYEFKDELKTKFIPKMMNETQTVTTVLIFYTQGQEVDDIVNEIPKIFPGVKYQREDFNIGAGCFATALRLEREGVLREHY